MRPLAAFLEASAPGPLDLDCTNVVHGETMVLEESPCETHLVGGLNEGGTEILHATVLILCHYVEG